MSIISFINPKGGSGKTTSALILATELANKGGDVCIIDADPMHWIARWAELPGKPPNITVISEVDRTNIVDHIETASETFSFVIVDLEGSASVMSSYAVALCDLVLTPIQPSSMDAEAGGEAFSMVHNQGRVQKRVIPQSIILTRTSAAIISRSLRAIRSQLDKAGVDVLNTSLVERAAFREIFAFGGDLHSLDPKDVNGLPKARANARSYADNILERLKELENG